MCRVNSDAASSSSLHKSPCLDQPMTTSRPFVYPALIPALIAAVLLLSMPGGATTVVALIDKRHHRAVLAADSLVGRYYAKTTDQDCKLIVRPDCAFAMAGFLDKPDPYFHLQDLGDAACQPQGTLKEQADGFLEIAKDPVSLNRAISARQRAAVLQRHVQQERRRVLRRGVCGRREREAGGLRARFQGCQRWQRQRPFQ